MHEHHNLIDLINTVKMTINVEKSFEKKLTGFSKTNFGIFLPNMRFGKSIMMDQIEYCRLFFIFAEISENH